MIAAILSLLGSSAVGSLLGGFFAWLNKKTDISIKQLDQLHETRKWDHELKLRESDLKVMAAELEARKDIAVVEGDSKIEAARMKAIADTQLADQITAAEIKEAGKWGWLLTWALAFNKLIRPMATVLLTLTALALNGLLVWKLSRGWEGLTNAQQFEMGMQAFAWITGQAAAVLSYWFVSRGSAR